MRAAFVVAVLLAAAVSGCSSVVDPDPPAPLPVLQSELPIHTLWRTQVGSGSAGQRVTLRPVFADDTLYVADRDGKVDAIDRRDGKHIWERSTGLEITGALGLGDQQLLVGTPNGEVVALSAADGTERWRSQVSSEIITPPQMAQGVVVAHCVDGNVYGLDAATGERKWFYQQRVPALSLRGAGMPIIADGSVYVGFASGKLAALEIDTGRLLWESAVAVPRGRTELDRMVDVDARPVFNNGTLFVAAYQGRVAAVASTTGVLLWARDISAYQPVSLAGDRLFVTDAHGHVWALGRDNGVALWKQEKLQARGLTAPVVFGDYLVVGDFEGYLHFLSVSDGRIVGRIQIDSDGLLEAPLVIDGVLYAYGEGGVLAALTLDGKS